MPDLTLPSCADSVRHATEEVEHVARALRWDPADVSRLAMAVSEAVANSVEHGPGGAIRLSVAEGADGGIWVGVHDEGPGPRADALASAALPEDPLRQGGRGLYIIRTVTDRSLVDAGGVRFLVSPASPR